jgi:hypothetical protein
MFNLVFLIVIGVVGIVRVVSWLRDPFPILVIEIEMSAGDENATVRHEGMAAAKHVEVGDRLRGDRLSCTHIVVRR